MKDAELWARMLYRAKLLLDAIEAYGDPSRSVKWISVTTAAAQLAHVMDSASDNGSGGSSG